VAAATAAATASATRGAGGGFWRAACDRRTENGKLNRGFFAGTLGTGDFLLAVDDDFFELRFAVVADVFVDGHARFLYMNFDYSNFHSFKRDRSRAFPSGRHRRGSQKKDPFSKTGDGASKTEE